MVVRSFIQAADVAEGFGVRLEVLLGSVKEGNRLFEDMAMFAGKVPFEYEKIMGASTALAGVMKGGVDEINAWMPMIADLAATTGLTLEDTTSQVIRMYSAGAASADMFRERGVLAMLGFQAGVSYSAEETREMMMKSWKKAGSQFAGATDKLALTWSGMTSMLADKWFAFRTMVMKSGVFDWMKSALSTLNEFLDDAFETGELKAWAKDASDFVIKTLERMVVGVGWLVDAWGGLKMVWMSLKIGFLAFADVVWTGLNKLRNAASEVAGFFSGEMSEAYRNSVAIGKEQENNIRLIREELAVSKKELIDYAVNFKYTSDAAKDLVKTIQDGTKKFANKDTEAAGAKLREEIAATKAEMKALADAEKAVLAEAMRIWDDTRTKQENYASTLERLDELVVMGAISWDEWGRAVEQADEGMKDLTDSGTTFASEMNNAVTGWASDFSSTLNDLLWSGEATFDKLLKSFAQMVTQMVIQSAVVKPLLSSFGFSFAKGGVFSGGRVQAFARGGVVDSPTVFPMANGMGLMGEAGPEAVMPLERDSAGRLGVRAQGGGSGVIVNIYNNTNSQVRVEESEDPGSVKTLDVIVDEIMSEKLVSGQSGKTLKGVFGLQPQLSGR